MKLLIYIVSYLHLLGLANAQASFSLSIQRDFIDRKNNFVALQELFDGFDINDYIIKSTGETESYYFYLSNLGLAKDYELAHRDCSLKKGRLLRISRESQQFLKSQSDVKKIWQQLWPYEAIGSNKYIYENSQRYVGSIDDKDTDVDPEEPDCFVYDKETDQVSIIQCDSDGIISL